MMQFVQNCGYRSESKLALKESMPEMTHDTADVFSRPSRFDGYLNRGYRWLKNASQESQEIRTYRAAPALLLGLHTPRQI